MVRKATLASVIAKAAVGIRFNEHMEFDDGEIVFLQHGVFARFSDWFPTKQKFDGFLNYVETAWGTGNSIAAFQPPAPVPCMTAAGNPAPRPVP